VAPTRRLVKDRGSPAGPRFRQEQCLARQSSSIEFTSSRLIAVNEAIGAHPGMVFDLTLPLDQVAEAYRAMDERRAIKTLLRP